MLGRLLICLLPILSFANNAETSDQLLMKLGNQTDHWVARAAYRKLKTRLIDGADVALEAKLHKCVADKNLQVRQLSTMLLIRCWDARCRKPETWPDAVLANLVEALRDDKINTRNKAMPNNGWFALYALGRVKHEKVRQLLRKELVIGDWQSRTWAASLIIHHWSPHKDDLVNNVLVKAMEHDKRPGNALWAYRHLSNLGKSNLQHILARKPQLDWQQAALLQVLCSKMEVKWYPPEETIKSWCRTFSHKDHYYNGTSNRLMATALYLCPKTSGVVPTKELPELTRKMNKLGKDLKKPSEKFAWSCTWATFLKDPR